jgi:U3 small nucleolar ribonucleoprotein protein IMP4
MTRFIYNNPYSFFPQLRRQARERRQYIYEKSLEAQERQTYERKRQLKDALASGKPLPTELKKDARDLGKDIALDEAQEGEHHHDTVLNTC